MVKYAERSGLLEEKYATPVEVAEYYSSIGSTDNVGGQSRSETYGVGGVQMAEYNSSFGSTEYAGGQSQSDTDGEGRVRYGIVAD